MTSQPAHPKPSICRIVVYRNQDGVDMPAIVTRVRKPEPDGVVYVDLHVFPPPGESPDVLSYQWGTPMHDGTGEPAPRTWRWPDVAKPDVYLTVDEVAALAHCAVTSIRRAIADGALVAVQPSRSLLIREQDARMWIESHPVAPRRSPSASDPGSVEPERGEASLHGRYATARAQRPPEIH